MPPSQVRSGGRGTEADSGSASQAQSRFRPKYGDPSDGLQGLNLWSQLSGTVFVFTKDFQKKVQWDSLDTQTQQQLTAWAPKAKDHLASSRESQGMPLVPFLPVSGLQSTRDADGLITHKQYSKGGSGVSSSTVFSRRTTRNSGTDMETS